MAEIYQNPNDPAHQQQVDAYYDEILALAALYLAGEITKRQYEAEHIRITETAILAGVITAGGNLDSTEVLRFLQEQSNQTRTSAANLADDLQSGRYSEQTVDGEMVQTEARGQEMLDNRLALWTAALGRAYSIGRVSSDELVTVRLPDGTVLTEEPWFQWEFGRTREHCGTCAGNVAAGPQPRSYWRQLARQGIYPQGPGLECRGFNCLCTLTEVSIEEIARGLVSA